MQWIYEKIKYDGTGKTPAWYLPPVICQAPVGITVWSASSLSRCPVGAPAPVPCASILRALSLTPSLRGHWCSLQRIVRPSPLWILNPREIKVLGPAELQAKACTQDCSGLLTSLTSIGLTYPFSDSQCQPQLLLTTPAPEGFPCRREEDTGVCGSLRI